MALKKDITITIGEDEISFVVTLADYDRFINEMQDSKKVVPAKSFIKRCVIPEDKATLTKYIEEHGAHMEIAGALLEEFKPKLEISIKK